MARVTHMTTVVELGDGVEFIFEPLTFGAKAALTERFSTILEHASDLSVMLKSDDKKGIVGEAVSGEGIGSMLKALFGNPEERDQLIEILKKHLKEVRGWTTQDAEGNEALVTPEFAIEHLELLDFVAIVMRLMQGEPGKEKNSKRPSRRSTSKKN